MRKILLFVCLSFFLFDCTKSLNETTINDNLNDTTTNQTNYNFTLRPDVYILDSSNYKLNQSLTLIQENKFEFSLNNKTIANYKIGDKIVIATNGGFIKKIVSIVNSTNKVTYTTSDVNMEEIIEKGNFTFNVNTDSLKIVQRGYSQNLNNIILFQNASTILKLDSGNISFDPDWKFDFDFKQSTGIQKFEMSCANTSLNANFDLSFVTNQNINIVNRIDTLQKLTTTYTKWIPVSGILFLPVVVVMDVRLLVRSNLNINGALTRKINISSKNSFGIGMNYENNQWNGIYNFTSSTDFNLKQNTGHLGYNYDFYLYPEISFKLYNVAGPYASIALRSNISGNFSNSLDWDQNAYTWLETTVGADAAILGKSLANYSKVWKTDSLKYNAPYEMKRISGDNQIGKPNQNLSLPIKVEILDSKGIPQSEVPVYFNVASGGGTVSSIKVLTDNSGFAETIWKIGSKLGTVVVGK